MSSKTRTITQAPLASKNKPRCGWPVVATGIRDYNNTKNSMRQYFGFPEESEDFSDDDVFDVAGHMIDRFCEPLPIVKKDVIAIATAEQICETEVA